MYSKKFIKQIQNDTITEAEKMTISELETFLRAANEAYYGTGNDLIDDNTYDILLDFLREKAPKSSIFTEIGTFTIPEKSKVKLPYHLGSMDKIKPGNKKLDNWFSKYTGEYVISDKLDGLSGLLEMEYTENMKIEGKLYTRGDGSYGQNISHLLKYINYGDKIAVERYLKKSGDKIVVRGEIIINEKLFNDKYAERYPKSRSLVAGTVNSKVESLNVSNARDLEFVSYQIVYPENMKAYDQFKQLRKIGFNTVYNEKRSEESVDELKEILLERRDKSDYKIDGIIISDNSKGYSNPKSGNPKHSVAFKMMLDEQQKTTIIEEIEYNISKNGILKPRIKYQPIKIDGDTLTYTTGFNAKYIKDNKLGPGAEIKIIRSGDVIPYIAEIIKPAVKWFEPTIEYKWNESSVDAIAVNLTESTEYLSKNLLHFFTTLGLDGMKIGTVNKLLKAGFDNIETILNLKETALLDVDGFNIRSAEILINNIKTQILDKIFPLEVIMTSSNIFQGFAVKKLKLITDYMKTENILDKDINGFGLLKLNANMITGIDGYSTKTANQLIKFIPAFVNWINKYPQLQIDFSVNEMDSSNDNQALKGEFIVMTGFRDANLQEKIEKMGGTIQSSVNGKTTLLIIKDKTAAKGSKWKKATDLGVKIIEKGDLAL